MSRVEDLLRSTIQQDDRRLSEVTGHLALAGGKRLRPLLTLCSAYTVQPGGSDRAVDDRVIAAAVAVELMHQGSLHHDDIIDEADSRRGVQSVNSRWDNTNAVLSGDLLLAKSSYLATELGAEECRVLAITLMQMCEGQMLESFALFDPERTEDEYFTCIAGKTAALMGAACHLGGLEGEGSSDDVQALRTFGRELGMAFQIIDDVRDLGADADEPGSDLLEGVYTLPVIHARHRLPELADLLEGVTRERPTTTATLRQIRDLVLGGDSVRRSIKQAETHLTRARATLLEAPGVDPTVRTQLLNVAEQVSALGGAAGVDDMPVPISA